jgi:hypothetical protein
MLLEIAFSSQYYCATLCFAAQVKLPASSTHSTSNSYSILQLLSNEVNSSSIAKNSKPTNNSHSFVTQIAVIPPRLSGVDIANMYLNERNLYTQ